MNTRTWVLQNTVLNSLSDAIGNEMAISGFQPKAKEFIAMHVLLTSDGCTPTMEPLREAMGEALLHFTARRAAQMLVGVYSVVWAMQWLTADDMRVIAAVNDGKVGSFNYETIEKMVSMLQDPEQRSEIRRACRIANETALQLRG